jgi:hypothetical protein
MESLTPKMKKEIPMRMQSKMMLAALIVAALATLLTAQSASAVAGGSGAGFDWADLGLDPNASGTKYYGTITIYYEDPTDEEGNVMFFVRIAKDNNLYAFGGSGTGGFGSPGVLVTNVIKPFFDSTVVFGILGHTAPSAFKAVSDGVQQDAQPPLFVTVDFTLAVRE